MTDAARVGRRGRRVAVWAALILAFAVALALGAQGAARQPTLAQRTTALSRQVRCPVCDGETVADSSAPGAITVRNLIRRELAAGEKPSAILHGLAAEYGPGILEEPPASGFDVLLWVLPVVAVLAAAGGLGAAFVWWGRRRRPVPASSADHDLVAAFLETDPAPPAGSAAPERTVAPGTA